MKKELIIKSQFDIAQPSQVVQMAKILKQHIVEQQLYTPIMGKNYVQVEGWQMAGGLLGLHPRVKEVINLSNENETKWQAVVEIISKGEVISQGFAICSNKETKKKSFDEYAILSMAQTRATGKAYRNIIGWVIKMAGYEATPVEEMTKAETEIDNDKAFDDLYHKLSSLKPEKQKELVEKTLLISPFVLTEEQKEKLKSLCQNTVSQ